VLLLLSVTTVPPVGAGSFSITVPVEEFPPATDVGLKLRPCVAGAFTVIVVVFVTPLNVPVIVTAVLLVTGNVVTVKVAEFDPATVTLAGT